MNLTAGHELGKAYIFGFMASIRNPSKYCKPASADMDAELEARGNAGGVAGQTARQVLSRCYEGH